VAVQAEQWGAAAVQLGKSSVWIYGAMRVLGADFITVFFVLSS